MGSSRPDHHQELFSCPSLDCEGQKTALVSWLVVEENDLSLKLGRSSCDSVQKDATSMLGVFAFFIRLFVPVSNC